MGESENNMVTAGELNSCDLNKIKEAVCVQVEKVYDSCKEKDCIEDAEVLFNKCDKKLIQNAVNVKVKKAEVKHVFADVEPVPFKRGFFTVDIKFFIVVTLDVFTREGIETVMGVVLFDKKVILFGSEGSVKIFKAKMMDSNNDDDNAGHSILQQDNKPMAKVEVADPIALTARIVEEGKCHNHHHHRFENLPDAVTRGLKGDDEGIELIKDTEDNKEDEKIVLVSLGLFSIIKLVRLTQLLIPAFSFCLPDKNCIAATEDDPCTLFETIAFPVNEFFPPQKMNFPGATEEENKMHHRT